MHHSITPVSARRAVCDGLNVLNGLNDLNRSLQRASVQTDRFAALGKSEMESNDQRNVSLSIGFDKLRLKGNTETELGNSFLVADQRTRAILITLYRKDCNQ